MKKSPQKAPVVETANANRLEALFNPRSVAVIGASARTGRPGFEAIKVLRDFGYSGTVYPVTPRYERVLELECYPSPSALPAPVDLAIIAGSPSRMEADLRAVAAHGIQAAVVFGNAYLPEDAAPPLRERVANIVRDTGIALLGPNTIGYTNYAGACAATWSAPLRREVGTVAAVMQSGSTYAYTNHLDPRVNFTFTVQPGQELGLTVAECLDYAIDVPGTRVVALYLETVRDPTSFVAALDKAARRRVPVVAIRIGRTASGSRHVASHAGRLAGNDAALTAVFERYGVLVTRTMDEWWATITLMSHDRRPGPGAIGAITDSGGQRALLADLAEDVGVSWTAITPATESRLRAVLDPSLPAVNPVDAWAGDPNWPDVFREGLSAVVDDPGTAVGVAFTEFGGGEHDNVPHGLAQVCIDVAATTGKPVIAATFTARQFYPSATHLMTDAGIPVLDGAESALLAIHHAFEHRDFRPRARGDEPARPDANLVQAWRGRLTEAPTFDETLALELLGAFGIPATRSLRVASADAAVQAAREMGGPVALKTASGIAHKTDRDGVRLDLVDETAVRIAYEDLASRLGPAAVISPMAPAGVEIALSVIVDDDFGPLIMVGTGGVLIELVADARFALAPVSEFEARELLQRLAIYPLLLGLRGRPTVDIEAVCAAVSRLSTLGVAFDDAIQEIEINPLIASPDGCIAVDALIRRPGEEMWVEPDETYSQDGSSE